MDELNAFFMVVRRGIDLEDALHALNEYAPDIVVTDRSGPIDGPKRWFTCQCNDGVYQKVFDAEIKLINCSKECGYIDDDGLKQLWWFKTTTKSPVIPLALEKYFEHVERVGDLHFHPYEGPPTLTIIEYHQEQKIIDEITF